MHWLRHRASSVAARARHAVRDEAAGNASDPAFARSLRHVLLRPADATTPRAVRGALAAATLLLLPAGCATPGPFTWVNDYKEPPAHAQPGYVIQPGDIIQIRVFNQPDMSSKAKVREDGKVSVPFLNDVVVAGQDPMRLPSSCRQS